MATNPSPPTKINTTIINIATSTKRKRESEREREIEIGKVERGHVGGKIGETTQVVRSASSGEIH